VNLKLKQTTWNYWEQHRTGYESKVACCFSQ